MSNIALPYTQIIDPSSFKSILNAKIYIGEYGVLPNPANSATWKQAYFVQDDGSRVAASQPIRTNAAGFAVDGSGNIRTVQVDGQYSLIVQDSFGVQKYSNTRVTDLAADLSNTTDPAKGAAMVGFLQAGTGAVGRTVQHKLRDQVSVKDFGAVGDGITDDTAAIQAAINASNNKRLLFPSGDYLTGKLTYSQEGNKPFFVGEGSGQSRIIHKNGEADYCIHVTGGTTGSPAPAFPYFGFSGLSFIAGNSSTSLIYFDGQVDNNCKFEDLQFISSAAPAGCHSISVKDYLNWNLNTIRFDYPAGYGIHVRDGSVFTGTHFVLNDFSYDNGTAGGSFGYGLFYISLTSLNASKGSAKFSNGRIEVNRDLASVKPANGLIRVVNNATYSATASALRVSFDSTQINAVTSAKDIKIISCDVNDVSVFCSSGTTSFGIISIYNNDAGTAKDAIAGKTNEQIELGLVVPSPGQVKQFPIGRQTKLFGSRVVDYDSDANFSGFLSQGDWALNKLPYNQAGRVGRVFAKKAVQTNPGLCQTSVSTISTGGGITSGTTTLSFSPAATSSSLVPGVSLDIAGAGVAGATLQSVIKSVTYTTPSGTSVDSVELLTAASTTVSGATVTTSLAQVMAVDMVFTGTAVPSTGTFQTGDKLLNTSISLSSPVVSWVCVTGGSPGTWRPSAFSTRLSTTANRPSLTSSDIGVMYLDTTLSANGKPIWWTGTQWVDSSGTAV